MEHHGLEFLHCRVILMDTRRRRWSELNTVVVILCGYEQSQVGQKRFDCVA